jgi:hypothetical protein
LPCLSAIGCALSPDYSFIDTSLESSQTWMNNEISQMNSPILNPNLMQDPFLNLAQAQDNSYEPMPINTSS